MKTKLTTKLALAAAVACVAVGGAWADHFNYHISDVATTDNGGTSKGNYTAYLFVNSTPSKTYEKTTGVTIQKVLDVISGADTSTTLKSLAFNNYSDNGSSANDVASGAAYWQKYTSGVQAFSDFSFFAVLLDGATLSDAKNYMIAKVNQEIDGNTYGDKGSYYMTASSATTKGGTIYGWGSQAGNSWISIASIPEPTSGVLLLVGVVALALKRKRYCVVA